MYHIYEIAIVMAEYEHLRATTYSFYCRNMKKKMKTEFASLWCVLGASRTQMRLSHTDPSTHGLKSTGTLRLLVKCVLHTRNTFSFKIHTGLQSSREVFEKGDCLERFRITQKRSRVSDAVEIASEILLAVSHLAIFLSQRISY